MAPSGHARRAQKKNETWPAVSLVRAALRVTLLWLVSRPKGSSETRHVILVASSDPLLAASLGCLTLSRQVGESLGPLRVGPRRLARSDRLDYRARRRGART
jgi:hypothetical protein